MARNTSFIKLDGTLDGLTFYRQNGESFVKTVSKVSKNRIMNDPAFKRTRENMQEFAGASAAGKAFRDGFAGLVQTFGDTYLSARVSGLMRRIISQGAGDRGERDLDMVSFMELLRKFEFNKTTVFDSKFFAPNTLPVINATRDQVTWSIPDFNTDSFINQPEGATHFRLVLAGGYVSNYGFVPSIKGYEPVDDSVNGRGGFDMTAEIPLGGMVGAATDLTLDLTALGAIPASSAFFVGVGIVFYQEVNGNFYELAQGNCLKIAVTG